MTRFRSLEIFQRIIHLSIIHLYIYIYLPFVCQNSLPPFLPPSTFPTEPIENRYRVVRRKKYLSTRVEFFNENPRHSRLLNRKKYKKLYKCQRLVLFVASSRLILSLSHFLREATKLREVNLFKEEIHSRPYSTRCNEIYPIETTDHNSSSNYHPLRCVCMHIYTKNSNDLFDGGGEERRGILRVNRCLQSGNGEEGIIRATTICLARDRVDRVIENSARGSRIDYSMINHRLYCAYHNGLRKRIY